MPFPPYRPSRVYSIFSGREVRLLARLPLRDSNNGPDGVKGEIRGMKSIRGDASVAHLKSEIDRYAALMARH